MKHNVGMLQYRVGRSAEQ